MTPDDKDLKTAGGYSDDAAAAHRAAKQREAQESGDAAQAALGRPDDIGGQTGIALANADATEATGADGAEQNGADVSSRDMRQMGRIRRLADRASTQMKGISGNKRVVAAVLGGGGIISILVALFLAFAQFKLIHMMENIAEHLFSRNKYMFEARRDMYMREFYNNHLGQPDRNIDDSTATLTQQIMRRMKDGLEPRLQEKYEIKIRADQNNPRYKIVTFTDKQTGEVTEFNTATQKKEARQFNRRVAADITQDDRWVKRIWYKNRMTRVTGTKWNWLDPIKQPYNKAKVVAANQVAKFLLSDQSKSSGIRNKVIEKVFGGTDAEDDLNEEIDTASSRDNNEKILSKQIIKASSKAATGVGLILLAVQITCTVNDLAEDDTFKKLARQKLEIEYMTQYASMISKASQLKLGKTDGDTVNAHMSLLTYTDENGKNHDATESNNYRRATGEKVPYTETDDCKNTAELCKSKQPGELSQSTLKNAVISMPGIYNDIMETLFPTQARTQDALCLAYDAVIEPILNLGASAVDFVMRNHPIFGGAWNELKEQSALAMEAVADWYIGFLAVSGVDADTVGPFLTNATMAGGSLAAASAAGSPAGTDQTGDDSKACHTKPADEREQDDSFCGKKLNRDQLVYMDRIIAQEQYEEFKTSPFTTKVASLDTPYSLASRIVDAVPASPETAIDRSADVMVASTDTRAWVKALQNLPSMVLPQTLAAPGDSSLVVKSDGTDQFNTAQYGFTVEELQRDLGSEELANLDRNVGCSMIIGLKDKDGKPISIPEKCKNVLEVEGEDTCTDPEETDIDRNIKLKSIAERNNLHSVVVREVGSKNLSSYNANENPNAPASLLKLIIVDAFVSSNININDQATVTSDIPYSGSSADGISVGDRVSYRDAITKAMSVSSNSHANLLIKAMGGPSGANAKVQSLGYTGTVINNYYRDGAAGVGNQSTALDVAKAMNKVYSSDDPGFKVAQQGLKRSSETFGLESEANKWGRRNDPAVTGTSSIFKVGSTKYAITIYVNAADGDSNIKSGAEEILEKLKGSRNVEGEEQDCSGDVELESGDTKELATKVLANKNIKYQGGDRLPFEQAARGEESLVDGANAGRTSAMMNPEMLKVLLAIGEDHEFYVSASTNGGHTSAESAHYKGKAIDIGSAGTGLETLGKIQRFIYKNRERLGSMDELIYLGQHHAVNKQLDQGKSVPDSTFGGHTDHLHFSVK